MKIDAAMIQSAAAFIAALAALVGALYGVITRPLVKLMADMRTDLMEFKKEMRGDLIDFKKEVRTELSKIDTRLERIEAELKVHGERLTRVEERLPPPLVRH